MASTTALAAVQRRYLNPIAAGAYINIAPHTLANWRSAGTGPRFHKRANRVLYSVADLDAWIEGR